MVFAFVRDFFESRYGAYGPFNDGGTIHNPVRCVCSYSGRGFYQCVDKGLSTHQGTGTDRVGKQR